MAGVLRGDIGWADLGGARGHEQAGRRPVLVLSHDVFNERSGTAIVVALTSQPQRAGFPLSVELVGLGLPKPSWVKVSQVRTVSTDRLGERLAVATPEQLVQVLDALSEIIGP